MSYKSFAVAGAIGGDSPIAGSLGTFIAKALLKAGASVKVLARASSAEKPAGKELIAAGATIAVVDYSDAASIEAAVSGVDVVISGLSAGGFAFQPALADASKKVGVKLFVPSEFGNDTFNAPADSPLYGKKQLQEKLKAIGLPYLLIFNGLFADWVGAAAVVPKDGEVTIVGDGKKEISFTARVDIASFLAHVLTTFSPAELANKVFPIESTRITILELVDAKSAKLGSPLKVKHITNEESLAEFKAGNFLGWLRTEWDSDRGTVSAKADLANGKFPEWNPTPVQNFL